MKNPRISIVVLFAVICLVIYFVLPFVQPIADKSSYILKVDKSSFIQTPEANIIDSFKNHKDQYIRVSEYNLTNEKLYRTRPVILNKYSSLLDKITDATVRRDAGDLLEIEAIQSISSLNDQTYKYADFMFNYKFGVYKQGILFQPDADIIANDISKYNYIKEYKALGDGWYYYIFYYDNIKNADAYRKVAWNRLDTRTQKSVNIDWKQAIVTMEDWDKVTIKLVDNVQYKFVISVCFNTNVDGLLGPIITYIDPQTSRVVGYEARY